MTTTVDYYEQLGVSKSADGATIKSAYRRLAMEHHPDRNPGDAQAETRFKACGEAYECLKDPQKRAAYDRYGHEAYINAAQGGGRGGAGAQGFGDFADIFESMFGDAFAGGGRQRRGPARGADLRYDIEISLEEAYHGKQSDVAIEVSEHCGDCAGSGAAPGTELRACNLCGGHGKVRAQQGFFVVERTCPNCQGRGQVIESPCKSCRGEGRVDVSKQLDVTIPPGVDNGTRIRLSGKGEAGPNGAAHGDLYIFVHVREHAIFSREGTTLFARVPVSFTTASLGGSIELPGLDGEEHSIRIPDGIQSGKQLRKRGAGMPVLQGRGFGDLVVEIAVETPTRLSARQKDILREFRETETGDECPEAQGFFGKIRTMFAE
ncbi:molecular chaperone DnaJ [Novosphingopyxis sp.]|uniref:molecular chaperone DnaJ n=1 Tax=Novosphingopyxis sp. TaxID=2709690 RepID=UPI003B5ADD54